MNLWARAAICLFGFSALAACKDPMPPNTTPQNPTPLEDCPASSDWLPQTPALTMFTPAPHPTTECPFYRGVWQNFLMAMQPDAQGNPALLSYPTIDTVFKRVNNPHGDSWSYLGDIKQAGERRILVDQNGNTLYYGIHMNQAFSDFIKNNGLQTAKAIQNYQATAPNLFFPAGVVELKSAWQVVDPGDSTASDPTFVTINTTVPTMHQDPTTGEITEDRSVPLMRTLRLLAIHVVYTYPGHPEFIWGSMEHTNANLGAGESDVKAADGHRDVAPVIGEATGQVENPSKDDPSNSKVLDAVSHNGFILYKADTAAAFGNVPMDEKDLHLDATKQKFLDSAGNPQQTSIYRMFPASKSNETTPDGAITSLNSNMEHVFAQANLDVTKDKRPFYRLVGAQWMDKPIHFQKDSPLQNNAASPYAQSAGTMVPVALDSGPDVPTMAIGPVQQDGSDPFTKAIVTDGSDSPYSILAGEDRMSSTAMESFTQPPGAFNNCFTCHNTQAINKNGVPVPGQSGGVQLLDAGLLNVSHILSQFVLEECAEGPNAVLMSGGANGSMRAVCP
jgi:hypothetical protein